MNKFEQVHVMKEAQYGVGAKWTHFNRSMLCGGPSHVAYSP